MASPAAPAVVGSAAIRFAATTLLLADVSSRGFDVLMVRRHSKARFMANVYVFPGGCLDEADRLAAAAAEVTSSWVRSKPKEQLPANVEGTLGPFRLAALRELEEETGLRLQQAAGVGSSSGVANLTLSDANAPVAIPSVVAADTLLTPYAHWITPKQEKYRYDTWFFVARAPQGFSATAQLRPDASEVADVRWVRPDDALRMHSDAACPAFRIPPPTFYTMKDLCRFRSSADVVAASEELLDKHGRNPHAAFPTILPSLKIRDGVIEKMWLRSDWIPEAVVPFTNSDPREPQHRRFNIPVYDASGAQRSIEVAIGGIPPDA